MANKNKKSNKQKSSKKPVQARPVKKPEVKKVEPVKENEESVKAEVVKPAIEASPVEDRVRLAELDKSDVRLPQPKSWWQNFKDGCAELFS